MLFRSRDGSAAGDGGEPSPGDALALAMRALARGNAQKAVTLCREAHAAHGSNAKLLALLGRSLVALGRHEEAAPVLEIGALRIDPNTRTVSVDDQPRELTMKEFDLLYFLAQNPRRVLNREQLLEAVWGGREYIDPGTVTVHIRRLREKIEAAPSEPSRIVTVWGVGYRLD